MNRVARVLLVVATCPAMLVSGLLLTTGPAAAAVPTSPYTALSVDGPADHPDLENGPFVAEPSNSTITLVGGHLEAHGTSGTGIVDLSPPTGQSSAVGTYDVAAAADATHAGFQLSTGGGVCPTSSDTLHVLQVTMSGSNFTT